MNARTTHVALITGATLHLLGLREILKQQRDGMVTIDHFGSFDEFKNSGADDFDILYVEDTLLALNSDFFRGKRCYVIPIISGVSPQEVPLESDGAQVYIHPRWDYATLEAAVKASFRASHVIKESTAEKGLSAREEEVLKEVARGLTNKEIADTLNISMNTVMSHRKNITAKLNIKTVSGLTFYALMNNLISGEEVVERASD